MFISIGNKFISTKNILSVTKSEVCSSKHTSCGRPYYLYSGHITIRYTNDLIETIDFDSISNENKLKNGMEEIARKIVEMATNLEKGC